MHMAPGTKLWVGSSAGDISESLKSRTESCVSGEVHCHSRWRLWASSLSDASDDPVLWRVGIGCIAVFRGTWQFSYRPLDPYYNCNKTCNMQHATHCSCKKRYYICNKTCNKRCNKLHNVADLISIILCAHNFIHDVASCSQSQHNVRPAHGCWRTPAWLSNSRRAAFEFL